MIAGIIGFVIGAAAGFGFMFWVAKEMVAKVRADEDDRHKKLMQEVAGREGVWIDVVNDIVDAVQEGKLSNKSVADQAAIVRRIVKDSRESDGMGGLSN